MKNINIFNKKLPVVLLTALLVLSGAGAAAGVTLAGNVTGDATTKVDQAIIANGVDAVDGDVNNDLGTVSDDGTMFKFAANINQGMDYDLVLDLENLADDDLNARLVLDVPEPLTYTIDANGSAISAARLSMSEWILNVGAGDDVDITITIAAPDDIEPGFYTIEGELFPTKV